MISQTLYPHIRSRYAFSVATWVRVRVRVRVAVKVVITFNYEE
jgi:hypothetical protein